MRKLALLVVISALLAPAQTASLTLTGPTRAAAGTPVVLMLSLVSGGGPAAIQWDMTNLPTGAGVQSSVANKSATCSFNRCLLWGMNAAAITDGQIATITYTQPATPAPFTITATLGASPAGAPVTVTPPTSITLPLQSACDVNNDGVVDAVDVNLVLQQAMSSTTGSPTVVDVMREVIAAMGGTCLR